MSRNALSSKEKLLCTQMQYIETIILLPFTVILFILDMLSRNISLQKIYDRRFKGLDQILAILIEDSRR